MEYCIKKYIIDRFEGKYAVCENQETSKMEDIEKIKIPQSAKEGDVILVECICEDSINSKNCKKSDTIKNIVIDEDETKRRKEKIEALRNKVKK